MDFMLSPSEKAQKYWMGFLCKTWLDCSDKFDWLKFEVKNKHLVAKGKQVLNGREFNFAIHFSPFFKVRFDRVFVESKDLKISADTHFNGDGSLCLYHPVFDLKNKPYMELIDVIPWISEWVYYYDKFLEYKTWLGPEYPHDVLCFSSSLS
jgi:hypothetical protein